jgi:hypothetical protein
MYCKKGAPTPTPHTHTLSHTHREREKRGGGKETCRVNFPCLLVKDNSAVGTVMYCHVQWVLSCRGAVAVLSVRAGACASMRMVGNC